MNYINSGTCYCDHTNCHESQLRQQCNSTSSDDYSTAKPTSVKSKKTSLYNESNRVTPGNESSNNIYGHGGYRDPLEGNNHVSMYENDLQYGDLITEKKSQQNSNQWTIQQQNQFNEYMEKYKNSQLANQQVSSYIHII